MGLADIDGSVKLGIGCLASFLLPFFFATIIYLLVARYRRGSVPPGNQVDGDDISTCRNVPGYVGPGININRITILRQNLILFGTLATGKCVLQGRGGMLAGLRTSPGYLRVDVKTRKSTMATMF